MNRYEDLEEAVKSAVSYDITEMKRLGIFDRSSFLDYMQDLVTTWIPTEDSDGKDVVLRLIIFYFIFGQDALKDLQSPIDPKSAGEPLTPLSY